MSFIRYQCPRERTKAGEDTGTRGLNSSVTTGLSAAYLNTESVRRARWWLDPRLEQQVWREAAELVAFDFFQPTLRSLGGISEAAKNLHSQPGFAEGVREMLSKDPSGEFFPLNLRNLLTRVEELETRLQKVLG